MGVFLFKAKSSFVALIAATALTACSSPVTNISEASDAALSDSMEIGRVEEFAPDRQIIQTGSVTLRVDEITESIPEVVALTESLAGRIDDQSQYTDPTQEKVTSANLLVRIPVESYQVFIDEVTKLGNVEALNVSSTDVTLQSVDLEARINSLENSISRLEQLVQEATNVADLIAAESALAERQAELDGLLSQQKYLSDQVTLASIYVYLLRKDALDSATPIGFWAGLERGFESVLLALGNSTTYLGLVLPWILAVALLLLVAKIIKWALNKRRR